MSRTANLRRQHDAAIQLSDEILSLSNAADGPANAARIAMTLAKLTGVLRIHFAQEDRVIYPYMLQSADRAAARVALTFQSEMGALSPRFQDYAQRWSTARAIAAGFIDFRSESKWLLSALVHRIRREDAELYPLADAMQPADVRRAG